jgi:uncharacterized protein YaaN involved in tellurite resistance
MGNTGQQLQPQPAITRVKLDEVLNGLNLDGNEQARLDGKVDEFVDQLLHSVEESDEFQRLLQALHDMGNKEMRATAAVSQRMLEGPMQRLATGLIKDESTLAGGLAELRHKVEELDPGNHGDLLAKRKLLGIIPIGNRLAGYFALYQDSQIDLNAIMQSLLKGQDGLRKENATIEQEKADLRQSMDKLKRYVYIGKQLDGKLEGLLDEIESRDPPKAQLVKEELLFYLKQKLQDLLTQLAVAMQGYMALDLIRKNNFELIKGIERATTTTISALRTAVIVAHALTNQRLVLDQISMLTSVTSETMRSVSGRLRNDAADIHKEASAEAGQIEQLKKSFQDIYQSIDMITDFKKEAVGNLQQTVHTLQNEIENAQNYLNQQSNSPKEVVELNHEDSQLQL